MFLCGVCFPYRLRVLFLREDGAVVCFRYLVVTDVLHYHCGFLFPDDTDCIPYEFLRVVAEHIQLGLADALQDGYDRAACQCRALGYFAHKVVLHGRCAYRAYPFRRGVRGSEARHTTTAQYYRDLIRQTGELEANVQQLQTEQQQADQQLDEVRQEVKSEKLEAAKTEAKAAFVAKVGSLFGGGKLKEFEHRNEDLQKRIQELEEEAIQREEQHVKQMQEMKNAYERQYRKLSEFTDFVKRYFPYVEKLMPTIKFLRDTLNFSDGLIKKLCMFKDVTIKGKLYSSEFRQVFKTDGSICSLKETSDGTFDLKIDGVSHISWFRRKKDEFMEALGLPTRKQNRSIKL